MYIFNSYIGYVLGLTFGFVWN